ncbi:Os03g0558400, partial [Oryza sativa Japonica Group]
GGLQSEEGWVGKLESKGVKKEKLPRCWNVSVFLSMFKVGPTRLNGGTQVWASQRHCHVGPGRGRLGKGEEDG